MAAADPIPYPNRGNIAPTTSLIGTGQDVEAYYLGSTGASFDEQVGMYVNGVLSPAGFVFPNHDTSFGSFVDLGYASVGSDLVFGLQVFDAYQGNFPSGTTINMGGNLTYTGTPSYTLYSVPSDAAYGFANSDGSNHAYITPFTLGDVSTSVPITGTYVGFEDLLTDGASGFSSDLNYTDEQFVFTGVTPGTASPPTVPEPAPVALFGLSLPVLGLMARRRACK